MYAPFSPYGRVHHLWIGRRENEKKRNRERTLKEAKKVNVINSVSTKKKDEVYL